LAGSCTVVITFRVMFHDRRALLPGHSMGTVTQSAPCANTSDVSRIVIFGRQRTPECMVTTPGVQKEVASSLRRISGERRRYAVRAEPDDTLLTAWQEAEPKLRRVAAAMGVGRQQVDDVLQDVYLAAHQSRPPPGDEESCRRWLFRVAINRCRLEHRRRKRWWAAWEKLHRVWTECLGGAGIEAAADGEEQMALRRALRRLSPELRNPIVLRYYCDLNSTEIGQVLDLPAATVRGQLRAGRTRLAEALRAAGFRLDQD
jgi:RNA polymerase sigma-70 factor (ECF subfamily)